MKLTVDLADPSDVAEAYVLLSDLVGTPAQAPAAPPAPAPACTPCPRSILHAEGDRRR